VTTPPAALPSQAELAYERLEHLLVTLELAPGAALREQILVDRVGLGRTPVREAVQRLAAEGLLLVRPRKGLRVRAMEREDLARVLEVRRVLERLLVVKAAERAQQDLRGALQSLAAHLGNAARLTPAEGQFDSFFRLDRRLDELLASAGHNPWLVSALAPLQVHCRRLWFKERQRLDLAQAAEWHAGLAAAVADGDGAASVRALNGIIAMLEGLLEAPS
jgi:DNA-binding GntR family transcriptional regulator